MVYKVQVTTRCYLILSGWHTVSRKVGPMMILLLITAELTFNKWIWFNTNIETDILTLAQMYCLDSFQKQETAWLSFCILANSKCLHTYVC